MNRNATKLLEQGTLAARSGIPYDPRVGAPPPDEPSPFDCRPAMHRGALQEFSPVPANRKAEVDAAVKDVDFAKNDYQVEFDTTMGRIVLDLFPDVAPGHCRNIIGLTKIGFYNGVIFHRVIRNFVIQGGCPEGTGYGGPGYQITAEFNDRLHEAGTLSMARSNDPHSGGSQFFICTARVPSLDRQYTVFGETADEASKQVALKIGNVSTGPGDRPVQDVKINAATVKAAPKG